MIELIIEKNLPDIQDSLVSGSDPNCRFRDWTPLHWAAQEGDAEIIRCLLDAGAEVDAQDSKGFTPLAIAIGEGEEGFTEKTSELLKGGACPSTRIESNEGCTVLRTAAAYGWFGIIKNLTDIKGIDLNIKDNEGRTPLSFAKDHGSQEIVDYLIQRGAVD